MRRPPPSSPESITICVGVIAPGPTPFRSRSKPRTDSDVPGMPAIDPALKVLVEGGVMRALGASRAQLRLGQLAEFGAIGLVAGLVAAIAASLLSMVIAREVFDLTPRFDWRVPLAGAALGVVAVVAFGLAATRRVVSAPPADTLRAFGPG